MVEMNEFSEINQNFDTIKTLLNSIRAQGILNTSDVDKLLTGINSKLEKINTDEDIDLIKVFLSELKHNLDERHNMLLSKFGAIESLFSNLLKNSSEMPKSADIKELFDIVATNLSVFSREVVAQKDSLNDINLRLDALRTDDTNKKDIIKNIVLLKPDIERLNNGFDSIVLSLNDNFKTIIKTITSLDNVEALNSFADNMKNIEVSSNTILSALQILDKKTEKVEVAVQNLATKEDLTFSNRKLVEITDVVNDISHKYVRVESLADKVDATVNIIAGMKTVLEEIGDKNSNLLVGQLKVLETELDKISSDTKFDEFKSSLELVLKNIVENISMLDQKVYNSFKEFDKIETLINALDINVNFKDILASISKMEEDVKASINEVSQKLLVMQDANLTRIVNDISLSAESLNARLNQSQSSIAVLCEKNFNSIFENVIELKALLTQIDENNVSANNAIFSSITDRLSLFERF